MGRSRPTSNGGDGSMDIAQEVLADLMAMDQDRPRSKQTALGMSMIGTCRRQAQYILQGTEKRGATSSLAAIVGTALHEGIQKARAHRPGIKQELEVDLLLDGGHRLLGHVDEVSVGERRVTDFKTSTAEKMAEVEEYGPPATYRNQIHLYAAALIGGGVLEDDPDDPITLQLVYLDRNGKADPLLWETEFTLEGLQPALDWLHEVNEGVAAGEDLPQDKPVTFCQDWCPFFWTCREPDLSAPTRELLEGEQADDARRYLELSGREAMLKAAKAEVKSRLAGVQGRTDDGVTVRWTSYDRDQYTVRAGHVDRLDVRRGSK